MASFMDRLRNGWNAFNGRDAPKVEYRDGPWTSSRSVPGTSPSFRWVNSGLINAMHTRIAIDCSMIPFGHVRCNEDGDFQEYIKDTLHECLTLNSNIDQHAIAFFQNLVYNMLTDGTVAALPTHANIDPENSDAYEIHELRVATPIEWAPEHVKLRLYNPNLADDWWEATYLKRIVAIIKNPLFDVSNDRNGVMSKVSRDMKILETLNDKSTSNSLDMLFIAQGSARNERIKESAKAQQESIAEQLKNNPHGYAVIDNTFQPYQLNRSLENNVQTQLEYDIKLAYSQIGMSEAIMNGTADAVQTTNYLNGIIRPILENIALEMKRKWLSKTAITQGQSIMYFNDIFKLIPVSQLAEIADKFTRNEILSSNEVRSGIGIKPSKDPKADELRNSNIAAQKEEVSNQNGSKSDQSDPGQEPS
jgi:hypothetical protein